MTRIAVLGAGPAGCGAAWRLRVEEKADVVLIEQGSDVGGNAGSFEYHGHILDYGSHRLHPVTQEDVLRDIKSFLGADLLDRPRHGRIRLRGRWVHFPLKPLDLMLHLDRGFALGALGDMVKKALGRSKEEGETFASILRANLGATICDDFYFPYARKIWGLEPEEMAGIQARRRVSAGSFGKLLKKVFGQIPGLKPRMAGRFYYPRDGFGSISRAYADRAEDLGAEVALENRVSALEKTSSGWRVTTVNNNRESTASFDQVWSTLPLTTLVSVMGEGVPEVVREATKKISYRAMILVYLELEQEQFTEFDAHYFPEANVLLTRLSESKNYAVRTQPEGRTVLCAEVPCNVGDSTWSAPDDELGRRIRDDLKACGLEVKGAVVDCFTRRMPQAYPLYPMGYEEPFGVLEDWVNGLEDFLSYGRQGLFAHDNTHHALAMAYAAVDCLKDGSFDRNLWGAYLKVFAKHVVED